MTHPNSADNVTSDIERSLTGPQDVHSIGPSECFSGRPRCPSPGNGPRPSLQGFNSAGSSCRDQHSHQDHNRSPVRTRSPQSHPQNIGNKDRGCSGQRRGPSERKHNGSPGLTSFQPLPGEGRAVVSVGRSWDLNQDSRKVGIPASYVSPQMDKHITNSKAPIYPLMPHQERSSPSAPASTTMFVERFLFPALSSSQGTCLTLTKPTQALQPPCQV